MTFLSPHSFFINLRLQRWYLFRALPSSLVPRAWQSWLMEPGSLTRRLICAADGDFEVKVVNEYWGMPRYDEARALAMSKPERVFVREVELRGHGQCWVQARTLIPAASLRGKLAGLRQLGPRPLGAKLFSLPTLKRGAIEISRLRTGQEAYWARRSVFSLEGQPLLVTEVFMPTLVQVT